MSTPNPHPHSCLGSLLHGLTPKATGYDSKSFTEVYPHSQEELKRLQCYASTTRFTLASGLAVIGKLLAQHEDLLGLIACIERDETGGTLQ